MSAEKQQEPECENCKAARRQRDQAEKRLDILETRVTSLRVALGQLLVWGQDEGENEWDPLRRVLERREKW
jgi:hypothetical protein